MRRRIGMKVNPIRSYLYFAPEIDLKLNSKKYFQFAEI